MKQNDQNQFRSGPVQGWYFHQDGITRGPCDARSIIDLSPKGHSGHEVLISRPGFKKWYPLRNLAGILRSHPHANDEINSEIKMLKESLDNRIRDLLEIRDGPVARYPLMGGRRTARQIDTTPRPVRAGGSPARDEPVFLLSRFLRLGQARRPWLRALPGFFFTFGLQWFFWYRKTRAELLWHLNGPALDPRQPPAFLALIPGLHMWMSLRLGRLLQEVERQNGYFRTDPLLAAMLALLPPLAMIYLQNRANLHWRRKADRHAY